MDLTDDYQKDYEFEPIYGDRSTTFHRHMRSVIVFTYLNTLQSMLVDYSVTEMVCFDDYLDAAPRAKTMRGNGITTFILHLPQHINFKQKQIAIATPNSE